MAKRIAVTVDQVRELYLSGLTARQIAGQLGCALNTVRNRLEEGDVPRRNASSWAKGREPLPIDLDRLRELVAQGLSTREIGAALEVSEETARQRMVDLGLERLPGKARPERNYFWKGGRTVDKQGYLLLHRPDHPYATANGYVRAHRLVMEERLGWFLEPTEVVHHIDKDPSNNDPSNLELFPSNADHLRHELTGQVPRWTEDGKRRIREGNQAANARRAANRPASGTGDG